MRCKIPSADLAQKLNDTICRYKGEPVYVRVDRTKIDLFKLDQPDKFIVSIKANDPDFDISGVPLGYMQSGKDVVYLTRIPFRKTKQGLDQKYVRARALVNNMVVAKSGLGYVFSKGFIDMVLGRYPGLKDAIFSVRKDFAENNKSQSQIAISREIGMWINEMGIINIHYKGDFVGWMQPDKFTVHVPSNDKGWVVSKFLAHELSWEID